jgi:hypothetical protein
MEASWVGKKREVGGHEEEMEFYSALKKNEILSFASKWMEVENIILSEVSQTQKNKNHMFSLICGL